MWVIGKWEGREFVALRTLHMTECQALRTLRTLAMANPGHPYCLYASGQLVEVCEGVRS